MAVLSSGNQLNIGDVRHDDSETIINALLSPEGYRGVS